MKKDAEKLQQRTVIQRLLRATSDADRLDSMSIRVKFATEHFRVRLRLAGCYGGLIIIIKILGQMEIFRVTSEISASLNEVREGARVRVFL